MGLKVQSINELDTAVVRAAQLQLSQLIQEKYPEVELQRGVLHDVVAFLAGGISGGVNQTEVNRVLDSRSLLAIQANPELADETLVDHVLSNYLISRKTGTRAKGEITIVVEGDGTVVSSANTLYVANGLNFYTDSAITARPPGNTITGTNDRILAARGDGTYEFSVPVTAELVGEAGNVRTGTKFTPETAPPRFVTAFTASDFTGGAAEETNTQLIARMEAGIPAKLVAGRLNTEALIKAQTAFADIKNISVIGYGDPEMERDQHWIFPVSGGGRVDIYAQTAPMPQTVTIKKNAVLLEVTSTETKWQFALARDDAPGFYYVSDIRRPDDPLDIAGFSPTSDQRSWDLGDDTWVPDVVSTHETNYTRYQTAIIQFTDTVTPVSGLTVGDTAEYNISLLTQPYIKDIQEFVAGDSHRNLSADTLVKAAVPCFLSLNFDIVKDVGESSPDTDAIIAALVEKINNLDFPGVLYASQLNAVIHQHLTGTQAVDKITMHGRIRRVDGDDTVIRDNQILRIPDTPSLLVTPRTTVFVLYPGDVGIAVVNRSN